MAVRGMSACQRLDGGALFPLKVVVAVSIFAAVVSALALAAIRTNAMLTTAYGGAYVAISATTTALSGLLSLIVAQCICRERMRLTRSQQTVIQDVGVNDNPRVHAEGPAVLEQNPLPEEGEVPPRGGAPFIDDEASREEPEQVAQERRESPHSPVDGGSVPAHEIHRPEAARVQPLPVDSPPAAPPQDPMTCFERLARHRTETIKDMITAMLSCAQSGGYPKDAQKEIDALKGRIDAIRGALMQDVQARPGAVELEQLALELDYICAIAPTELAGVMDNETILAVIGTLGTLLKSKAQAEIIKRLNLHFTGDSLNRKYTRTQAAIAALAPTLILIVRWLAGQKDKQRYREILRLRAGDDIVSHVRRVTAAFR